MGVFDIFKKGLSKTRNFVSNSFTKIAANTGHFDEDQLDELEEILVMADCGVGASSEIIEYIKTSIRKTGDDSQETVMNLVKDKIVDILGEKTTYELEDNKLNVLVMIGVNGTGKTTTAGKIAERYKSLGKKVVLAAADTFRAAAIEQLKAWGERTSTPVIAHEANSDPASVCFDAIASAKARKADLLIIDTAGRLHNKKNLMDELSKIMRVINREASDANIKTMLIIDATTGQNAVMQAEVFGQATDLDYVGITKLDGTAKGGVAISVAYSSKTPIVLAGLGEGKEDLVDFDPVYFASSLIDSEAN